MNNFLVGLQFLTRITVKKNLDWSEKACGGSVKFFPFIGAILSIIYVIFGYVIYFLLPQYNFNLSTLLIGFILLALNIFLTGALHCDGFTDTMDGILSGRKRERILEIMKDSRVGAHGATSLILLLIGKFAMFSDLNSTVALTALFFMPIIPRACMSNAVVHFPYARKEGLGKAFHQYSSQKDMLIAGFFTCLLSLLLGKIAIIAYVLTTLIMYSFNRYVSHLLGGLTGDVYGATTELGEFVVLFIFVIAQTFIL
ncbi:adenosylcobinamide-GDP ribazoletransferase [Megamonas hypermegale]|uniref:adenosylcobinamide-GDP ribazoletransferase n=1 Tax=Megamonas hypermegale TaxID=158847 RepID=UPI00195869E7|nr:adenosylcobinamide-GDP ribazoletransferase [Megamonas hypermegale]MBM6760116.1 adenosylcobinamide-GDP ribazoletransferase [Megamonas hypermegale]